MPSIANRRRKGCFPRAEPEQTIKDRRAHVERQRRQIEELAIRDAELLERRERFSARANGASPSDALDARPRLRLVSG